MQRQKLDFYQPVNKANPFDRAVVEKLKVGKWAPASEINLKRDLVQHSDQSQGEKVITALNLFDPKGNRSVLQDFVQKKSATDRLEDQRLRLIHRAYYNQFGVAPGGNSMNVGSSLGPTSSNYASYSGSGGGLVTSSGYQNSQQQYPINQVDGASYWGMNNQINTTPSYGYYQPSPPVYVQSPQVLVSPMTIASTSSPYDPMPCMCLECQRIEQLGLRSPFAAYPASTPTRYIATPHLGCNCVECQVQNRDLSFI